jgi:hypothetical protein
MKKTMIVLVSVLLILSSSVVFADDSDTKVTVGLKAWYNWWTHSVDYSNGTSHSWDNGSALMLGPSLNIKFGKVFLGASYLKSMSNYKAPDWYVATDSMEFERKDIDATLGVMFTPYFGAFVGYKSIDAPMTYTNAAAGISGQSVGSWKLDGPGIGLLGNIPLGQSAAFYGNLAFMSVSQKFAYTTGTRTSFDMTGASMELGAAFAVAGSLSSNIGLKYQTFFGDSSTNDTHYQTFYGPVFGLNYSF